MKLLIPPPLVALTSALLMWAIAFQFDALEFAFPFQKAIAFALIGLGASLDIVSLVAFRRAKTTVTPLSPEKASSLVVSGLYSVTRNPMYLGLLIILCGIAIFLGSLFNAAIVVAFIGYITAFQIKPEEDRLEDIFGAQYLSYKKNVRRWL